MYAATRLHQSNKTVVVIEPRDQLGGHVDTFIDPASGQTTDVGVLYYHNISVVTNFAAYLDVPLEPVALLSSQQQVYVDFTTSAVVPQSAISSLGELVPAFAKYYQLLSQYGYLQSGFHLPSPVPEDLYSTWSDFITKYNLTGLAFTVDSFNQGWVDILNMPALYVLKGFGQLLLDSFISGYEVRTAGHNNQELFVAAAAKLGTSSVLTSSTVKHIHRSKIGVRMVVDTPAGVRQIQAKKLLITAPPLLSNLEPIMRLSNDEVQIFKQFSCGYYWNAIVAETGLPDDLSLYGVGTGNQYYIADQPGMLTVIPSDLPGYHRVYFGSPSAKSDGQVSKDLLAALRRASTSLGYNSSRASVPYIRSHAPYHCTVSADQIKGGFYDRLQALQGRSSTFYTGATFQAHDSGSIWLFTENEILPQLLMV